MVVNPSDIGNLTGEERKYISALEKFIDQKLLAGHTPKELKSEKGIMVSIPSPFEEESSGGEFMVRDKVIAALIKMYTYSGFRVESKKWDGQRYLYDLHFYAKE